MGIIGTNGSSKSTILKIITGVLMRQRRRSGQRQDFNPFGAGSRFQHGVQRDENVYLNGSMIGFLRKEIDEKLQDILISRGYRRICIPARQNVFQRYVCGIGFM